MQHVVWLLVAYKLVTPMDTTQVAPREQPIVMGIYANKDACESARNAASPGRGFSKRSPECLARAMSE